VSLFAFGLDQMAQLDTDSAPPPARAASAPPILDGGR